MCFETYSVTISRASPNTDCVIELIQISCVISRGLGTAVIEIAEIAADAFEILETVWWCSVRARDLEK